MKTQDSRYEISSFLKQSWSYWVFKQVVQTKIGMKSIGSNIMLIQIFSTALT